MRKIALFGIRSPLLPDYEETCRRLGLEIAAAVHTDEHRPRVLDRDPVMEMSDLDDRHLSLPYVACAFSPKRRRELAEMADAAGLVPADPLIDPSAVVASSTRIGGGSFINAGVIIGAASVIGDHVFMNRSTNLGHHGMIGDFASVGPGVTMAGNVHLGCNSFIGAGSVILPGIRIGDGAVIGAGSVVRADVPNGVLAAGNPANTVREQPGPNVFGEPGEE